MSGKVLLETLVAVEAVLFQWEQRITAALAGTD
jgi:hypothetical protein